MSRIVSSNTWILCLRNFTSARQRVWSNADTVFHNRFAHPYHTDKVTQCFEARENVQLEDVNLVENSNNEFNKASKGGAMKGDTQRFSTAAVKSRKFPDSPGPNTRCGSQHD